MFKKIILTLSSSIIFMNTSWADLPLTIEELLAEKNQFRFRFGLNYTSSDRSDIDSQYDLVQTGDGSFVLLPIYVGEVRRNRDVLAATLGGRYGVALNTEVYTRLTATADNVRMQSGAKTDSHSVQRFSDFFIGVNHQFSQDQDTPAFLGFAELSLVENTAIDGSDFIYGKTWQVGFTTYRVIDPVVLSLTAGYRFATSRDVNNLTLNPGDLLFINPSVGFAVNNEVTLTGGLVLKFRGKDQIEGSSLGIRASQTNLELGLGYAPTDSMTLNFNVLADISGNTGAQTGFNLLYKFD